MKIAVASSGLGHVARGVETWARDSAVALAAYESKRRGPSGALGASVRRQEAMQDKMEGRQGAERIGQGAWGKAQSAERRTKSEERGDDGEHFFVTLFSGALIPGLLFHPSFLSVVVIPCLKRGDPAARQLVAFLPSWLWRWRLKSEYGWEQLSFWWKLWPILRRDKFDILHVQDPLLAFWCRKFRKLGILKTVEILAHGTEETPDFLNQFDYVQHLAPWHAEQAVRGQKSEDRKQRTERRDWRCVPNFVDTEIFKPIQDTSYRFQDLARIRKKFEIPGDAFVIGDVAAVKKNHKRVDYLIREFADLCQVLQVTGCRLHPFLLVAGARCDDTDELVALAERLAPGRMKIVTDLQRELMPDLYRSMDVFVHSALFEMMPIAFLEAMASGLPMICHHHPVMKWIIGEKGRGQGAESMAQRAWRIGEEKRTDDRGQYSVISNNRQRTTDNSLCAGACIDMEKKGALAEFLGKVTPEWIAEHGKLARERAEKMFSKDVVVQQMVELYEEVVRSAGSKAHSAEGKE